MKQQQMNVYARFVSDEPALETARTGSTKARHTRARGNAAGVRSLKPGLKKRGALPK